MGLGNKFEELRWKNWRKILVNYIFGENGEIGWKWDFYRNWGKNVILANNVGNWEIIFLKWEF